jgi:hypothetical protein
MMMQAIMKDAKQGIVYDKKQVISFERRRGMLGEADGWMLPLFFGGSCLLS